MLFYEVMYIVQPDLEGDDLEEASEKVKGAVEKDGGAVVHLKKMGKRRLAYEIDDFRDGFYFLMNVKAEKSIVPALEHFFKVNEGYLRYIVIRLHEEMLAEEEAGESSEIEASDKVEEEVTEE